MNTIIKKAWASVHPDSDKVTVTLQYTGNGNIDTLVRNSLKAINQSAGVAVRRYRVAKFQSWGATDWAYNTGADYHQVTAIYEMER